MVNNRACFETFVSMEPTAKGRPRVTRSGHAFTPTKTVQAEHRIQRQVSDEFPYPPLEGPLEVGIVVRLLKPKSAPKKRITWPISRPDVDNYAKLVLDALNGILWRDDSQVVELRVLKAFCTAEHPHPGIGLEVGLVLLESVATLPPTPPASAPPFCPGDDDAA